MTKQRGISFSFYAVAGLIILFTLVYVVNMARTHMTSVIPTQVVRMGTNDVPHTIPAVIIRDERVYHAPRAGALVFAVGEGERVRAGAHIASVQDLDRVAQINHDIQALDQRGLDIGEMRNAADDPQIIRINAHIHDTVDNRVHSFTAVNFAELHTLRDNLNHSIHNRNQLIISGALQAGGDYARQQADLFARLGVYSTDIIAHSGGIMTPILDGLEDTFALSNMPNLTREQLNFTPDEFPLFARREVAMNEPAFKIVGNSWYIAAYIPNELIQGFAAGQSRNIYLENPTSGEFMPVTVRVHEIVPATRDSRVVFRSSRYVLEFINQRNVNIRTTQTVERGLIIPNTAVTSREYIVLPINFLHGVVEHSVLRYTGEGSEIVPILVSESTGANVYITSDLLNVGDVLLDGLGGFHTLMEIRIVQGIYRVNLTGYARFLRIHADELITDRGGTTLLCPVRNTLREFDTIVVDADTVNEGDLI